MVPKTKLLSISHCPSTIDVSANVPSSALADGAEMREGGAVPNPEVGVVESGMGEAGL